MSKHTPGPWVLGTDICPITGTVDVSAPLWDRFATVVVQMECGDIVEEGTANANLIAAAPDLLEALEWASQFVPRCALDSAKSREKIAKMDAAIAKAKGDAS